MTHTEILELVREHCPQLANKIYLHETGNEIHELVQLASHLDLEKREDGYDKGCKVSYQDGYIKGSKDSYEGGYQDGYADGEK